MAKTTTLQPLYIGTDFVYPFKVALEEDETVSPNVVLWTLSFMVKKFLTDSDAKAIITKTIVNGGIVVAGTFNATYATNQQLVSVAFSDTDTDGKKPRKYKYELKRMDNGFESVLANGTLEFLQAVHRT